MATNLQMKMKLTSGTVQLVGEKAASYLLTAVVGDENKPWSKFTPAGQLGFTVTNPDAPLLEPGEYMVTVTKVE